MSSKITLKQIKALKSDYFKDMDLNDPASLINNFYGIEGEQANLIYQTARNTQEHLLKGSEAIHQLLYEVVVFQKNFAPDAVDSILLMLPYITGLTRGINLVLVQLAGE